MNFDAGSSSATDPIERVSCRPDFQVLIYSGSSDRLTVKSGMPPTFIALGAKTRPDISLGMAKLYLKYKEADIPCELHIYSNAGHGFGFRPGTTDGAGDWPKRLKEWSIEHEYSLMTTREGLEKAIGFLQSIVLNAPKGDVTWA